MERKAGRQRPRPPEANSVVLHDPGWAVAFQEIAGRVKALLGDADAIVEHVGSTAVPGLVAKPIIDIDVVVQTAEDIPKAVKLLEAGGYVHRGDLGIAGREAFDVPLDMAYHHLYVVAAGTKPHLDHVLLRDYLRHHPEAAERYSARKLEVAHLITSQSRQAYLEAKAAVVEELLIAARREAAR